ncbi:MAG: MmgE/PrpD family protein [Rhodospirillales bacterium]
MISPLMAELSAYLASAPRRDVPSDVIEKAKLRILDALAAMISGATLKPGYAAIDFMSRQGGTGEATVAAACYVTTAINAAQVNGTLAHADETDDTHQRARFHPGCVIVPAALAVAERGHHTGAALIKAVVLGYDIGTRFNLALGPDVLFNDAAHATCTGAQFGATAACGLLLGVDDRQARYEISYAMQQAAGVPCWHRDNEHMEKAFVFGGMPARNAVQAALFAAAGFSGVDDVLSGPHNYFDVFTNDPHPDEITKDLGTRFDVLDANLKKWCVGMPAQSPLDAIEILTANHDIQPDQVKKIVITLPEGRYAISDNSLMPNMCLQHLSALYLIDRHLDFENTHDEARMKDADIMSLRRKVELVPDKDLRTAQPPRQAIVEITMKDGRIFRHHTKAVRGSAANPMDRADVAAKAQSLMRPVLGAEKAARLIERILDLETVTDATDLRPLLQP